MSGNSLKIRSKFINKISNKLVKLNEDLELLAKVDRKIFRNKSVQSGGADVNVNEVQKEAIKKLLEIKKAQNDINAATAQATNLSKQIKQITDALSTIQDTVKQIGIKIPDTLAAARFDVSALSEEVVNLLIEKGNELKWSDIKEQANSGLANEEAFNQLKDFLWPAAESFTAPVEAAAEASAAAAAGTAAAPSEGTSRKYRFW